uniref:histone acetyltransferase n=1 Tax=Oryzias latipes TaxID=8090 RepID=H2MSH2_ORYLA
MEKKLAEYKCDTNEAISLKVVRFPEDVDDDSTTFHPEFSHQVFGDDEIAFGYKGLQIQLFYTAGNLSTLFKVKYSSKVTEAFDCVEPDDVEGKIREIIPAGFTSNTDDFTSLLEKEANFKPFGTLLHSYTVHNEEAGEFTYQIHKVEISCPGFREYHERLQTFLMWFIETASFIDADDDRWDFFLVFEKYNKDGETLYATVGYMTVYNYYVYPDKTRPRVSQMLILPPFQGEGHGAQLLEAVHRFYCSLPKVQDITGEHLFIPLMVFLDICNAVCFHRGCSCWTTFKHARRVYEILRLRATDMSDEKQAREYRLEVKKRLFGPYRKNQRELAKMKKCLRPEELVSHMGQMDTQTQHEELEKSYQDVVEGYRRIIERIATHA